MSDTTPRLALPLLAAGQAQKELFHNEALARIDAAVQAVAVAAGEETPPAAPQPGQCWIVGAAPTGDWSEQAQALAIWTEGGWRFVPPPIGMTVWLAGDMVPALFDGTRWIAGELRANRLLIEGVPVVGPRQPAIAAPAGGTVADGEARTAITAILAALAAHGLIAQ
jgi:hypothetical protein